MTAPRNTAPEGVPAHDGRNPGGASPPEAPGKAPNGAKPGGRRKIRRQGTAAVPAGASGALFEIRQFAASLRGGCREAGRVLGVSGELVRQALSGTYPAFPHRLLEAWARHRAAQADSTAPLLLRRVRLGRVLVAGHYYTAPGLARLNGQQVVLRLDGERRFLIYATACAGRDLVVFGHAVPRAELQGLQPGSPANPQGEPS